MLFCVNVVLSIKNRQKVQKSMIQISEYYLILYKQALLLYFLFNGVKLETRVSSINFGIRHFMKCIKRELVYTSSET